MVLKNPNFINHLVPATGINRKKLILFSNGLFDRLKLRFWSGDLLPGIHQRKACHEGDKDVKNQYSTWEQAEFAKLNMRIDKLEKMLDELSDTFDDVRNAYHLY